MRTRMRFGVSVVLGTLALGWSAAFGQTFDSGSTGADGAFAPTASTTIALPPSGVFNFTTINIPSGVTVKFARNATNTPVTLLASGNVTIAGIIDLNGTAGGGSSSGTRLGSNRGLGGPGGFDGGDGANGIASTTGGSGLGPGGGSGSTSSSTGGGGAGFLNAGQQGISTGGAGGAAYGTPELLPIIGGSGGGGQGASFGTSGAGGSGGGGAILIASSGTITLTGTIRAQGGTNVFTSFSGSGSGGAVRLVATTLTGSGGTIDVRGGSVTAAGSAGRIRLEAFTNSATITFTAGIAPSLAQPSTAILPNTPTLRIASVAGVAAPASPASSFSNPDIVLPADTTNPVTVNLEASNIPLGTTMTVKATGQTGAATSATSTGLSGTVASSTASATVTIPTNQPSVISATASFTLIALGTGGPVFVQGEEVTHIRVATTWGGPSRVTYLTTSGREIPAELVAMHLMSP